jgi:hypothetical protein
LMVAPQQVLAPGYQGTRASRGSTTRGRRAHLVHAQRSEAVGDDAAAVLQQSAVPRAVLAVGGGRLQVQLRQHQRAALPCSGSGRSACERGTGIFTTLVVAESSKTQPLPALGDWDLWNSQRARGGGHQHSSAEVARMNAYAVLDVFRFVVTSRGCTPPTKCNHSRGGAVLGIPVCCKCCGLTAELLLPPCTGRITRGCCRCSCCPTGASRSLHRSSTSALCTNACHLHKQQSRRTQGRGSMEASWPGTHAAAPGARS